MAGKQTVSVERILRHHHAGATVEAIGAIFRMPYDDVADVLARHVPTLEAAWRRAQEIADLGP